MLVYFESHLKGRIKLRTNKVHSLNAYSITLATLFCESIVLREIFAKRSIREIISKSSEFIFANWLNVESVAGTLQFQKGFVEKNKEKKIFIFARI